MRPSDIDEQTNIEDLVATWPGVVGFLMDRFSLRLICCGTPVWANLGQVARNKGIPPDEVVQALQRELGARS